MTPAPARFSASARVRFAAFAVLIVGWLVAAIVYVVSPMADDAGAGAYRIVGGQAFASDEVSSRELQQLERLGGTFAVLTFRFNRWFVSLWSGRRLALTLAVLSLLVAAAGLRIASLTEETSPPRPTR